MTALLSFALIAVLTTRSALALTTFTPNCTLPDTSYNYVAAVNMRTILDIVWSSLSTLIACTYTVLHLNVPEQRGGRDPGVLGNLKWLFKGLAPSIKWAAIAFLAPDYYAISAVRQYFAAKRCLREIQRQLKDRTPGCNDFAMTHAWYVRMGGFAIKQNMSSKCPRVIHLTGSSFLALICGSNPSLSEHVQLPTEADINDRSKSDSFAKCLGLLQIMYYILSCLTRIATNLAVTHLEMGVFGAAACSLISWTLFWNKPRTINTAVILADFQQEIPKSIAEVIEADKETGLYTSVYTCTNNLIRDKSDPDIFRDCILDLAFMGLSVILGMFHIVATSFAFPSDTDRLLWTICAVLSWLYAYCTFNLFGSIQRASPVVGALMLFWPGFSFDKSSDQVAKRYMTFRNRDGLYHLVVAGFFLLRAILMFEMVRLLFYVPPGALVATWTSSLPHTG